MDYNYVYIINVIRLLRSKFLLWLNEAWKLVLGCMVIKIFMI